MSAQPIGLAVFGAGRIGAVHARNATQLQGAELIGVADIDTAAATRVVEQCKSGRTGDVGSFLVDPRVAAVIVATPTESHAGLARQAAAAGKHILCEKPLAVTIAASRNVLQAADQAGVALQVGFQRRFDPGFVDARRCVQTGELGTPRLLRLVGRDRTMPSLEYLRTSGGQFVDQMIHEFDLARWLLAPDEVQEIFATGSATIDPQISVFGDADTTVAVLRFKSGALGVLDGSREAVYGYDVRAELHGSKGLLFVGADRFRNGKLLGTAAATPEVNSFIERFEKAYYAELQDFADVIALRRKPRVGAHDAIEALRLALCATRSFHEERPVKLSEIDDE